MDVVLGMSKTTEGSTVASLCGFLAAGGGFESDDLWVMAPI